MVNGSDKNGVLEKMLIIIISEEKILLVLLKEVI